MCCKNNVDRKGKFRKFLLYSPGMNEAIKYLAGRTIRPSAVEFSLIRLIVALVAAGLIIGTAFMGKDILNAYRVHSQVSQIAALDEAVNHFREKYEGLPGDLLAIRADRLGLPAGDGTPGHGDGDGKISPCNPGWQWHLGCETALFWSHLSVTEMIPDNFTADSRFINGRLTYVGSMGPYLPQAAIGEGVFITVWNSDQSQPSPQTQMPYGNYYEISRISGVEHEKMIDDSGAITPLQARDIDLKMDDGLPLSGRVAANGNADWPKQTWGTYARPGAANCVSEDNAYNTRRFLTAHAQLCHLAIELK
jgi:hypothetical protein